MFILGITGGIGCGKSTAADICRQAGLAVIDADELSRQVTAPGGSAVAELANLFGQGIMTESGALDRDKMARLVFRDRKLLDKLSSVVHRHVLDMMQREIERMAESGSKAVVLDVPIPVRHGFVDLCSQVWVVWSSDDVRIRRLARRGMDETEVRRRMAMQMSREEYIGLADHVIDNDGTLEELSDKVRNLLKQELGERGIRIQ